MGSIGRSLILGLGNTALSDDGAGVHASRLVVDILPDGAEVDVLEAEIGGFALLDLLEGYRLAIVIDAVVMPGLDPGALITMDLSELKPSLHLVAGHEIDMPTALELGRMLGMTMPERLVIVGIQAADTTTLCERATPAVEAVFPEAAALAVRLASTP